MNKLIIFDCDGVLIDSEIISCRVESEALSEYGYCISEEETLRRFAGVSAESMLEAIKKETKINFAPDFLEKNQQKIINELAMATDPLMKALLEFLEQGNIARAVASGSPRDRVLRSLSITNQMSYFQPDHIFTAQQVQHGKPAPDLFLLTAREMGFAPEDCIVIEDSTAGIEAAMAANMPVLGYVGSTHGQYDWHQEKLRKYDVPLAKTAQELIILLQGY